MLTFEPDARRARIARPGEAPIDGGPSGPIDGRLVCYYPCPAVPTPPCSTAQAAVRATWGNAVYDAALLFR